MLLIADAGASKTLWYTNQQPPQSLLGPSLQALHHSAQELQHRLQTLPPTWRKQTQILYFFGTGCSLPQAQIRLQSCLQSCFPQAQIYIDTDLKAAAIAAHYQAKQELCLAILGTGSIAASFDGLELKQQQTSLGYWLGDEASATDLGKSLIQAFFYRKLSPFLTQKLEQKFDLNRNDFLQELYQGQTSKQNLFTKFLPFILEYQNETSLQQLIQTRCQSFFELHLQAYPAKLPIYLFGGLAQALKPIWTQILAQNNRQLAHIQTNPFPELLLALQN